MLFIGILAILVISLSVVITGIYVPCFLACKLFKIGTKDLTDIYGHFMVFCVCAEVLCGIFYLTGLVAAYIALILH